MSDLPEGSPTGDIIDRLRQHWPEIVVSAACEDGDLASPAVASPAVASPTVIRVRVATDVYLDAVRGEFGWMARPMVLTAGAIGPVAGNSAYGIGVTTNDGPELIADRFYEEVRYWWARLHPAEAETPHPA